MKTLEILDKYRKILAPILQCREEEISFYQGKELIGQMDYDKNEVSKNWTLGDYKVTRIEEVVGSFKLYQLQHCCAFAVSCNARIEEPFRGKRVGTILNQLRQDICRALGYSALLCTDIEQNEYQRKLLKTNGWRDIFNLVNRRTNNRVYLSVINL